jgi:hypothetical protein
MYRKLLEMDPRLLQYILEFFEQLGDGVAPPDAPRATGEPAKVIPPPPSRVLSESSHIRPPDSTANIFALSHSTDAPWRVASLIFLPCTLAAAARPRVRERKR